MGDPRTQPFRRKLEYLQLFALNICIFNEFFHSDVIDLWIPIRSLALKSADSIKALSRITKASRGCYGSDVKWWLPDEDGGGTPTSQNGPRRRTPWATTSSPNNPPVVLPKNKFFSLLKANFPQQKRTGWLFHTEINLRDGGARLETCGGLLCSCPPSQRSFYPRNVVRPARSTARTLGKSRRGSIDRYHWTLIHVLTLDGLKIKFYESIFPFSLLFVLSS